MNNQVSRLAVFALLLVVALIVATTYWQTWAAAGLADRQDNAIQRVAQFSVDRGLIYTERGHVMLARNVKKKVKGQTLYFRRYPARGLVAQTVGYSTQGRSRAGLEQSINDYLVGANQNLSTVLRRSLDTLKGTTVKGNDVVLTVNPRAQRLALNLLGRRCGAVVALEPSTGRVLVIASSPTYDPNDVESDFRAINRIRAECAPASPLVNRATQGLYPPGSTFKVVTTAAALDSHKYTPQSPFYDPGYCIEYGQKVSNAGNPEAPEAFGSVNLFFGLVHSVNSVFCNIGKRLGAIPILDKAKKFGFYSKAPLETPGSERAASGLYKDGKPFFPDSEAQVDPGRLAFGQERLQTTPLQMAMVAAAIANRGELMEPHVVDHIVGPGGGTITTTKPRKLDDATTPLTAQRITLMMQGVVTSGTGTAGAIPGVSVAGKTGTAETGIPGVNTTWFIAFAPADHPRVAIAVVVEKQRGYGGTVAAPIARSVMQALLGSPSNS